MGRTESIQLFEKAPADRTDQRMVFVSLTFQYLSGLHSNAQTCAALPHMATAPVDSPRSATTRRVHHRYLSDQRKHEPSNGDR
jgi:hypothetical protein